jgi:hypothetical protein
MMKIRLIYKESKMEKKCYFFKEDEVIEGNMSSPDFIVEYPEKFGFSKVELEKFHDSYGEDYGSEGNAIMSIILNLTTKGWIILEMTPGDECWIVLFDSIQNRKDILIKLIAKAQQSMKIMKFDDSMKAYGLEDDYRFESGKGGVAGLFTRLITDGKMESVMDENGNPKLVYAEVDGASDFE